MSMLPTNASPTNGTIIDNATNALSKVRVMVQQPAVQRALPAILIVIMLTLGFIAWTFLSEPARKALYPGMAEADKSSVIETLSGAGIDAVVDSSSGDIMVGISDYYRARMLLASAGLPQSVPTGSDVITELPMGASRSVESTRLRQSQEIELARSISEIDVIQSARVHLALPERTAFLRDTQPPSGSVFLQLAFGRALDRNQVEAIVNLVSSSIPGMARQDVTVVDQMGRLLSRGSDDASLGLSDRELEHRIQIENLYRNRVEAILSPIVGPENISVQVTVDMDFSRIETTSEQLDPLGTVVLSEQETLSESAAASNRGIPGAISNTPPPTPRLEALGTADTEVVEPETPSTRSSSSTRNFEVSRTVTATKNAASQITRVSAAVLIQAPLADEGEEGAKGPELESLEQLVRSAIGFNDNRGDTVTILSQSFQPTVMPPVSTYNDISWLPDVIRQVAIIAGLAIIGFGVVRPILDRVLVPINETIATANNMHTAAIEVGEGESLSDVRKRLATRRALMTDAALTNGVTRDERFAVVRHLAAEDPSRIAGILHRMISKEIDQVN